jgi:methyl-accepting chemotaxis protein
MKFTHVAGYAMGASVLAHLYQFSTATTAPLLLVVNLAALAVLAYTAVESHKQRAAGFDVIVAAETIVAFGIMSLILSLTVALAPMFSGARQLDLTSLKSVQTAALPFLEGLATAGIAPLVAMLVRNRAVEQDAVANPTGDVTDLSQALASLTAEVRQTNTVVSELGSAVGAATRSTSGFAQEVTEDAKQLALALAQAEARVRTLSEATTDGASQLQDLRHELEQLNSSAAGARTMLDALAQLIESVERFIAPAAKTSTR